jgi:GNAT superfamily N-acetyltransferase
MNSFKKSRHTITLETTPASEDVRRIEQGLLQYNLQFAPPDGFQPLTIFLRNEDQTLIGGLLGETYWGWLHISILWLEESARGQGYGAQILQMAEEEAKCRGCHGIHLDTLNFQAPDFYQRHGYTAFGVLEDHPTGNTRYFLTKKLVSNWSKVA